MNQNNQTWGVFETRFQNPLPNNEQEDMKILLGDFFTTKLGISDSRIDFDEKDKTILRYAVPTRAIKGNDELRLMTEFLKSKADVVETTFPGQMISDPDVTKLIAKAAPSN